MTIGEFTMEHRRTSRSVAGMPAHIYADSGRAGGTITNVGINGIFIESDLKTTLSQQLEIRCFLDKDSVFEDCCFKGEVVHRQRGGFGLEIKESNFQTRLALQWQMVYQCEAGRC
jgi:hypothetical protein